MKKKKWITWALVIALMCSSTWPVFAEEPDSQEQTESSEVKNGLIRENGKTYYYINGELATNTGWITTTAGKKVYVLKGGEIATTPRKISGKVYAFKSDGTLNKKKGIYKMNGNEYWGNGKGVLKTGWQANSKNAMYFDKNTGAMVKGKKVGYLKIPKNGRLGKAYARGVKILNKKGWNLKAAFNYSVKNTSYAYHDMRKPSSEAYANFGFTKHKGNCYVFAGQFYVLAKLLGYDVRQMYGYVKRRGNPHSWTVIKIKGETWVYDPSFHDHGRRIVNGKRVGTGYHFKYGTKNTWRYMNIKVLQK